MCSDRLPVLAHCEWVSVKMLTGSDCCSTAIATLDETSVPAIAVVAQLTSIFGSWMLVIVISCRKCVYHGGLRKMIEVSNFEIGLRRTG